MMSRLVKRGCILSKMVYRSYIYISGSQRKPYEWPDVAFMLLEWDDKRKTTEGTINWLDGEVDKKFVGSVSNSSSKLGEKG